MKLFILAALALVLGGEAATNCHWGPSYWCKSEATAKECGVTEYCEQNVWKRPTSPVGGNPIACEVCKIVVDFIEKQLNNNATEAQVKKALLEFCNSTGPLASACVSFVNDEFDTIWNDIVNGAGDQACSTIGACTSEVKKVSRPLVMKTMVKKPNSLECEMCNIVATQILKMIDSNTTETEAKVEIKKVCVYLGGFASVCRGMIDMYFDDIWKLAVSEIGNGTMICQKIKLCAAKLRTHPLVLPKVKDTLCDTCKLVVNFIKPFVDKNTTEPEVKNALEMFCSALKFIPGNASAECEHLLDQYFDLMWTVLKTEVDSGDACHLIKLCNESATVVSMVKAKPRPQAPSDTACDLCTLAVSFIKPFVDSNTTEDEVKQAVLKVCSFLPSSIAGECNSTVNMYFDTIWQLLKDEVDSGDVCKQIGLCPSTKVLKSSVGNAEECAACKLVVKYLRGILDSNITETEAKALVEKVCEEAGPMKDECDSMVDSYFPMVWKLITSYVDDDQICAEIKLCSSNTVQLKARKPNVGGGVFCMVCELVMKELTSMLDSNTTEQAIEDALDKVCDALPSSFKSDCTQFVKKYAPEIIELILSGTAAKAVCTALGLCVVTKEELVAVQGGNMEECEICKMVLEVAKRAIESKSAEQKVDEVIENVCRLVPSGIRSECKTFIETFGPELIQLLDKAVDPKAICTELKLCTSGAKVPMAKKY